MLIVEFYFNNTIRNITVAVGTLFKEIYTQKYDNSGKIIKTPQVLLKYWPKLHWFERNTAGSVLDKYGVGAVLPMISYSMTGLTPDPKRQLSKYEIISTDTTLHPAIGAWAKQATPYNYTFEFIVWTDKMAEMSQIVEQILPRFNPTMNFHVMEAPALGIRRTVRALFNSNSWLPGKTYDIKTDRVLEYSFTLTLESSLYPPVTDQGLINQIILNYRDMDSEEIFETTTISSTP